MNAKEARIKSLKNREDLISTQLIRILRIINEGVEEGKLHTWLHGEEMYPENEEWLKKEEYIIGHTVALSIGDLSTKISW